MATTPGFAHLRRLIDDTGIWQHATGTVPARQHGYCLDDAARAAMVTARLAAIEPTWSTACASCCRFIDEAISPIGGAHNFRDASGIWLDEPYLGDHVGRTVWALGELSRDAEPSIATWAGVHLEHLVGQAVDAPMSQHERTYVLLGLAAASRPSLRDTAHDQLAQLLHAVPVGSRWPWPERRVRYDAARIPEALLRAGAAFDVPDAIDVGMAMVHWLTELVVQDARVHRYPGHLGLGPGEALQDSGDEQPLEAAAFAGAHVAARRAGGGPVHDEQARRALRWFHGANRLRVPLVDPVTDGCHDGLGRTARNDNQGAESTLAYAAAWLTVCRPNA